MNPENELTSNKSLVHSERPLPGVVENGVLFGLEETLFLAGGAHSVLDVATAAREVSEQSFTNFAANLQSRVSWANSRGIGYLHVIFPDKQSIVPQRWPFQPPVKLGELYINRTSSSLPLIYPVNLLAEQAPRVVSLTDTHVTDIGSIIVASHIVEYFVGYSQITVLNQLLQTVTSIESRPGDLGSKLVPPIIAPHAYSNAILPGRWVHNNLTGGNNGLVDLRFCNMPIYDKRIVIFGDSFAREMARFLQFWFREVIFFRSGFFHSELADLCKPDFLLTENVERYLDNCRPDCERPSFFMYPHFQGDSYSPSAEFASAFSAILSNPRQPYIDFYQAEFGTKLDISADKKKPDGSYTLPSTLEIQKKYDAVYDIATIEPVRIVPRNMPVFIDNLPINGIDPRSSATQDIHGSFLVNRKDVLLFGPSIQVDLSGRWSCESRAFGEQFVDMVSSEGFQNTFPGSKPGIEPTAAGYRLDFTKIIDQITVIEEPVFLATPLEPNNWGRWVSSVFPKIADFQQYGVNRKLLCYCGIKWQSSLLNFLGVQDDRIIRHDPGMTYFCRDLTSIEYSVTNMTVSQRERDRFAALVAEVRQRACSLSGRFCEKIFVSRLSFSVKHPSYRVLQNELDLIKRLKSLGFDIVEPELLSFDEQIIVFSSAKIIVSLGGAAVYNAVFCAPKAVFITIESSDQFIRPHCDLLSSLSLRYGVIVGVQDASDPAPIHKRWSVDVNAVCSRIVEFSRGIM